MVPRKKSTRRSKRNQPKKSPPLTHRSFSDFEIRQAAARIRIPARLRYQVEHRAENMARELAQKVGLWKRIDSKQRIVFAGYVKDWLLAKTAQNLVVTEQIQRLGSDWRTWPRSEQAVYLCATEYLGVKERPFAVIEEMYKIPHIVLTLEEIVEHGK